MQKKYSKRVSKNDVLEAKTSLRISSCAHERTRAVFSFRFARGTVMKYGRCNPPIHHYLSRLPRIKAGNHARRPMCVFLHVRILRHSHNAKGRRLLCLLLLRLREMSINAGKVPRYINPTKTAKRSNGVLRYRERAFLDSANTKVRAETPKPKTEGHPRHQPQENPYHSAS